MVNFYIMKIDECYDLSTLNDEQLQKVYKDNQSVMHMNFTTFKMMSKELIFTFDCYESACYPTFSGKTELKNRDIINASELFKDSVSENITLKW